MASTADALARKLSDLDRRLRAVETGSQLSNTSFEDPDGNTVNAVDGILQGVAASGDASDALATAQSALDAAAAATTAAQEAHDLASTITTTQITDEAITTPKIAVGAITADLIAANSIQAGMIAAGAIKAGSFAAGAIEAADIAAGAITADKLDANAINGKTITGATIRTAESGQRVEIDSLNAPNKIAIYSGVTGENSPAELVASAAGGSGSVSLSAPWVGGNPAASLELFADGADIIIPSGAFTVFGAVKRSLTGDAGVSLYGRDDLMIGTGTITIAAGAAAGQAVFHYFGDNHAHPLGAPTLCWIFPGAYTNNTPVVPNTFNVGATGFTGRVQYSDETKVAPAGGWAVPVTWLAVWP